MTVNYTLSERINLHVPERISQADAQRQQATSEALLRRLADRPGVILADEVGMGKTFVALAVAASVALADQKRRPVVVMVPSSLQKKWPGDFALFREKCLSPASEADKARNLDCGEASRAVDFLKLIDDPPERRKFILFVTHGAMSRGLTDGWVKLALIRTAMRWKPDRIEARTRSVRRIVAPDAVGRIARRVDLGQTPRHSAETLAGDPPRRRHSRLR